MDKKFFLVRHVSSSGYCSLFLENGEFVRLYSTMFEASAVALEEGGKEIYIRELFVQEGEVAVSLTRFVEAATAHTYDIDPLCMLVEVAA